MSTSSEKDKYKKNFDEFQMSFQTDNPWGTLYFYENQNMVLKYELTGNEPIKITNKSISGLMFDWQHAIGQGFTLKRNADNMNVIEMAPLDDSSNANKYKVIVGDEEIVVKSG
jgi:hypothetical protein